MQQMARIAMHTAGKTARLGKGCNKEYGHLLPLQSNAHDVKILNKL